MSSLPQLKMHMTAGGLLLLSIRSFSRSRNNLKRATTAEGNTFAGICCNRLNQTRFNSSSTSQDQSSASPSSTDSSGAVGIQNQQSNEGQHKGGFIRAMAKIEGHESFAKMLRNSPLIQMGDPQGKIVEGTITHIVDDDLYIDFGAKFNCVCSRPQKNGPSYTLGKKVRIVIHSLELSTRFMGAKTDLTILEADCTLLGLLGKQSSLSFSGSTNEDTISNK